LLSSVAGVAIITFAAYSLIPINATSVGFAYLLLVLIIASTWGFIEALLASIGATLAFNFFFLPPIGAFTIADPQNWVALFSFLATSLIASRLSDRAKRRALDAVERQQDLERLYTFSRAILLIDSGVGRLFSFQSEDFPDELNLPKDIPFRQPPHLAFPDHVQNLVALNRPPGSIERSKTLAGIHPPLDPSMVLFHNIV
jgi:hypothetical protein